MESIENGTKSKQKRGQMTRWNHIERKQNNLVKFSIRCNDGQSTYLNNLRNKTFFKDYHIAWLNGERKHALDPNIVMDLRHTKVRDIRNKTKMNVEDENLRQNGVYANVTDEQQHFNGGFLPCAEAIDVEIDRFKASLEHRRPKPALDFYEYLNSNKKYKFIRAKLNRHMERPASVNVVADLRVCYRNVDVDNECDDDYGDDSNSVDGLRIRNVGSNYLSRSCNEYTRSCRDNIDTDEFVCDSNPHSYDDQLQSDLKVEIIPKLRNIEPIEMRGYAAIAFDGLREDANTSTVADEVCVTDPENSQPPSLSDHTVNADAKNFEPLAEHLKVSKITIDRPKALSPSHCTETEQDFDSMANQERNAIICEIFSEQKRANFVMLQKYFLKWFHYSTIEKMTKEGAIGIDQTRLQKIQKFLQNITIERKVFDCRVKTKPRTEERIEAVVKRRDAINDTNTLTRKYNSKLKLQQDIIELQRTKLERQERLITELRLTKLSDEAKEAQCELKKELRQVIQMGCGPSRSKARCLQMIGNLKDPQDEDEYTKLLAKGSTVPRFLLEMQARAIEREVKHQQAKERRENAEKEREDQRLASEDAKRQQDEDSKRQRIEELRRKRREENQLKIKREQERLAYLANIRRADDHYRLKLLQRGFLGLRRLIAMTRRAEKLALDFQHFKLRQDILRKWKQKVDEIWCERKARADNFDKKRRLRLVMDLWKRFYLIEHSKRLVAEDWYDMRILERSFNRWNCVTAQNRMIMENKTKQAIAHYEWNLKWRVLDHWCRLRVILRIERETEARRERWRHKIWELLPDYTPNRENQ